MLQYVCFCFVIQPQVSLHTSWLKHETRPRTITSLPEDPKVAGKSNYVDEQTTRLKTALDQLTAKMGAVETGTVCGRLLIS